MYDSLAGRLLDFLLFFFVGVINIPYEGCRIKRTFLQAPICVRLKISEVDMAEILALYQSILYGTRENVSVRWWTSDITMILFHNATAVCLLKSGNPHICIYTYIYTYIYKVFDPVKNSFK